MRPNGEWRWRILVALGLVFGVVVLGSTGLAAEPLQPASLCAESTSEPHHLATSLELLYRSRLEADRGQANAQASESGLDVQGDRVRVVVHVSDPQMAGQMLQDVGFSEELALGTSRQGTVPVLQLMALATLDSVTLVRPPLTPLTMDVTSQGVALLGAPAWHAAGYQGAGLDIAVLDLGFEGYASLLGTELPAAVAVYSARASGDIGAGEKHGTGCAEIIYDMVPDAHLRLVNFGTDLEFQTAVDYAVSQGVDLVSCSVGWPLGGPGDGTFEVGSIPDKVVQATDAGILWVNAAGNQAQRHWLGTWNDPDGDAFLEFVGSDDSNHITVEQDTMVRVAMRWDETWGAATCDFELALFDSARNKVSWSQTAATAPGDPTRFLAYSAGAAGAYQIAVIRHDGGTSFPRIELFAYDQDLQYATVQSSLVVPADLAQVLSVGAVPYDRAYQIEPYSSQGPSLSGWTKPDIVGPDGVDNVSYAVDGGFWGTSAACPHIAGLAALVWQAYPELDRLGVENYLRDDLAVDLGVAGPDNVFGYGIPFLGPAPSGVTITPSPTATSVGTIPVISPTPTGSPNATATVTPTGPASASPTATLSATPAGATPTPTATFTSVPSVSGWRRVGLVGRNVTAISVSPVENGLIVVGTNDTGQTVYISEDGGHSWRASSTCLSECRVYALAQDAHDPRTIYAATADKLWKSTDIGYHWNYVPVRQAPFSRLSGVAAAPSQSGRLYVTAWEACAAVFVSNDAGGSWEQHQALDLCSYNPLDNSMVVSAQNADKVYVARAHDRPDILRSLDAGRHWTRMADVASGAGVHDLALMAHDDNGIYAGTFGAGVHLSTDGGASWQCASGGLPVGASGVDVTAVCSDPRDDHVAYAAVAEFGIYETHDSGAWWSAFGSLPGTVRVHDLVMVSGVPWRIWAVTDDGVWVYEWPGISLPLVMRAFLVPTPTVPPTPTCTATATATASPTPTAVASATVTPTSVQTSAPTPALTMTSVYPGPATATATPWPGSTATVMPSSTPGAPAGVDLIRNGSFEGDWAWVRPVTPHRADYTQAQVHSGSWAMRLGIQPEYPAVWSFSPAYQVVAIPADATRATLRFWWKRGTEEPYTWSSGIMPLASHGEPLTLGALGYTDDCHEVLLLASDMQTVLSFVARGLSNDSDWVLVERDLLPWRGREVIVYFDAYNHTDQIHRTWMFVDDVSLEVDVPVAATP